MPIHYGVCIVGVEKLIRTVLLTLKSAEDAISKLREGSAASVSSSVIICCMLAG